MRNSVKNETLFCRKYCRQEAAECDKSTQLASLNQKGLLIICLTSLHNWLTNFFEIQKKTVHTSPTVAGQRKHEVDLVVLAKYNVFTKDQKSVTILQEFLNKKQILTFWIRLFRSKTCKSTNAEEEINQV